MIRPSRSRAPSMTQISPRRTTGTVHLVVHHRDLAFVGQRGVLVVQAGPADRVGVRGEDLAQRALAGGLVDPGGQGNAVLLGPAPGIRDRVVGEGEGYLRGHTDDRTGSQAAPPYSWRSLRSRGPAASKVTPSLVAALLSPDATGRGPYSRRSLRSRGSYRRAAALARRRAAYRASWRRDRPARRRGSGPRRDRPSRPRRRIQAGARRRAPATESTAAPPTRDPGPGRCRRSPGDTPSPR